ncbi:MAG: hypothetical protein L3J35_09585 [Bacteroidales bacterium]|nr:hypothetical protein [Bacteroidales bacterium]
MSKNCPKTENCPLFRGEMLASKKAQEIYMRIYCTSGETGRNRCKRFQLVKEGYKPNPDLMPNDDRTAEDIIKDM